MTAGSDQLTVTWVAPSNNGSAITGYDVAHCTSTDDCTDDSGNWTDNSVSSDTLSYDITGLSNGTTYKVRVRATNDVGDGIWSNTVNGTPVDKPDAPATVDVASGSGRLIVSWSTPTSNGATVNGFKLRYCNTQDDTKDCYSDYDDWSSVTVSGASTRTKTITGLTNEESHDVEIATTSSDGGDSDWYSAGSGTPGGPNKVTTFSVTAGSGQFTISGTAPAKNSSDISYYDIAYCIDAPADDDSSDVCANDRWTTSTEYVQDTSATTFSFDIYVSPTTKYKVRIRAENNQGKGAWSATKSVTTT